MSADRDTSSFLSTLDDGRVAIAALALGCIRACLELSTQYALQRTSFGVPIGRKQGVAFQIADLDVMAAAAHQLVYAAAAMRDHGAQCTGVQPRGRDRQALRHRVRRQRRTDRHPGVRGLWVHGGVPGSPLLPRREGAGDRRGHLGGTAALDRPPARAPGGVVDHGPRSGLRASVRFLPPERAAAKLASANKLFVRDRIDLLFDECTFVEDGQLANAHGRGSARRRRGHRTRPGPGRPALVVANDPSVKAGSWGARTVEKIIRMTEVALRDELPIFWFIDSAGARITDQVDLFPGRRGAGRIFRNQVALSGKVPRSAASSDRARPAARTFRPSVTW